MYRPRSFTRSLAAAARIVALGASLSAFAQPTPGPSASGAVATAASADQEAVQLLSDYLKVDVAFGRRFLQDLVGRLATE